MEQKRIKLLHILRDDKFVDSPLSFFERDGRFDNESILIVDSKDYKFRLIKNTERIKLLYNKKMIKEELRRNDYDAVFFYSLPHYHLFKYIPKDKIIIWWAWGFDIYGSERFIDIPLYKPFTSQYLFKNTTFLARVKELVKRLPFVLDIRNGSKRKAIKRIDYFQPVIHTEFELMQNNKGFRAKEFYYPGAHDLKVRMGDIPMHNESILIGHSATPINNHLDVWDKVKDFVPSSSTIFFPISYGIPEFSEFLTNNIKSKTNNICFMKEFMPPADYFKIVDSCSYAVFGVLREAAMGNMNRCIAKGVKLFLYRDSVPYQYFKNLGCIIFAIEEIDENSFRIPLTAEQVENNRQCLIKDRDYVEYVREKAIAEMQNIVEKQKTEK